MFVWLGTYQMGRCSGHIVLRNHCIGLSISWLKSANKKTDYKSNLCKFTLRLNYIITFFIYHEHICIRVFVYFKIKGFGRKI